MPLLLLFASGAKAPANTDRRMFALGSEGITRGPADEEGVTQQQRLEGLRMHKRYTGGTHLLANSISQRDRRSGFR